MCIAKAFWTLGQLSYPTSNFLYMVNRPRMHWDPIAKTIATGFTPEACNGEMRMGSAGSPAIVRPGLGDIPGVPDDTALLCVWIRGSPRGLRDIWHTPARP